MGPPPLKGPPPMLLVGPPKLNLPIPPKNDPPKLNLPIPPKNDPPKLNAVPPISSLTSKKEDKNDTPVVMRQAVSIVDVPPESDNSTKKISKIF